MKASARLFVGLSMAILAPGWGPLRAVAASAEPSSAPTESGAPVASPSVAPDECPPDEQEQGPDGTPGLGAVKSPLAQGRILMTVGGLVGPTGVFAVAIIDPTGVHQVNTTVDHTMNGLTWATADSAVFDSERAGHRHLFRLNLADGSIDQITADATDAEGDASVAPDGRIVHEQWSCVTGLMLGLHVTSADGTQSTAITAAQASADQAYDDQPGVSPDGQTVAFVHEDGQGNGTIFTVPIGGGTTTSLTENLPDVEGPHWSPDGSKILFSHAGASNSTDLWTVPVTGGAPTQITHSGAMTSSWAADWSPDGTQIVFKKFAYGAVEDDVRVVNADGSNEQVLWAGDNASAEQPDWGN
jgi:hypothetical protein